jgi:dolichyl-phosphate-mannose-protein mannosyltransferase
VIRRDSRATLLALVLLAAFAAVELGWRRAPEITDDWNGWRQADTQAIARNFAFVDANPLTPRVDWGGDGPGFVESELQLYPALFAPVLRAAPGSVLPGQLLSLASLLVAAWMAFAALRARHGDAPALAALALLLGGHAAVHLGTAIQPDALGFALYVGGFVSFLGFVERERRGSLIAAGVLTALAGLVKPTLLQLGLVQVALIAFAKPRLFARRDVWIVWAAVLAVVVAYLLHARRLHLVYGNTFGSISGGDSKFPRPRDLVSPAALLGLARMTVVWGIGWAALVAAAILAWKRRLGAEEKALALGALAMGLVSLRYASHKFGAHYHIPTALLGAWLVARAVAAFPGLLRPRRAAAVVAIAIALSGVELSRSLHALRMLPPEPETALGHALAARVRPGERVVVRSRAPARDERWDTGNNFEDPRVFYLAQARGWVLPSDLAGAAPVAGPAARGASHYIEPAGTPAAADPALTSWLATQARLVVDDAAGRIFQLGDPPRSR